MLCHQRETKYRLAPTKITNRSGTLCADTRATRKNWLQLSSQPHRGKDKHLHRDNHHGDGLLTIKVK
jgi:hypothetical protein